MTKLKTLSDYVKEQDKPGANWQNVDWSKEFEYRFKKIVKRNDFLRQRLEEPYIIDGEECDPKNRFVPTDKDGNVLGNPEFEPPVFLESKYQQKLKEFEQAEQRVLFKGFSLYEDSVLSPGVGHIIYAGFVNEFSYNTIEELCNLGLELTSTGEKLAGI